MKNFMVAETTQRIARTTHDIYEEGNFRMKPTGNFNIVKGDIDQRKTVYAEVIQILRKEATRTGLLKVVTAA